MSRPARNLRRRVAVAVALIAAAALAIGWRIVMGGPGESVATFTRPDGAYRVIVVRLPRWPGVFPGQSRDAPGIVQLVNRRGDVLHESPVAMVQLADQVSWEPRAVHIKGVVDWELPE